MSKQPDLPFEETLPVKQEPDTSAIYFHLPTDLKAELIKSIKLQNLSITGVLNGIISDYIDGIQKLFKPKRKTGRGNIDLETLNKCKEFLRMKHPGRVRKVDIAKYCDVSQARARGLLDMLSGAENKGNSASEHINNNFLVWSDDEGKYGIFKDTETGITEPVFND